MFYFLPSCNLFIHSQRKVTHLMSTYCMPSNEQDRSLIQEVHSKFLRAGIMSFPFYISAFFQPPQIPIVLCSLHFQGRRVNALVCCSHKYITSESQTGLSQLCEILCWKSANDAIGPSVLQGGKWALEANIEAANHL